MKFSKLNLINMHLYRSVILQKNKTKKFDEPWISKELKKLIAEKLHLYNKHKFSRNYDVLDESKKCRNLMNRKLPDSHPKYSLNFFKQCETSKQKWNIIKKNYETTNKVLICLKLK